MNVLVIKMLLIWGENFLNNLLIVIICFVWWVVLMCKGWIDGVWVRVFEGWWDCFDLKIWDWDLWC